MHETSTESIIFAAGLNKWRISHGMGITDLANLLNVSKQMVSDVLSGRRQFSADTAFRVIDTLNKFQGTLPMNNQNELEVLDLVNAAVIARHAGKAKIKFFQRKFGLKENDGFLPERTDEPDTADDLVSASARIAALIASGDLKTAADLLSQIQKQTRVVHSTVKRGTVNRSGPTQVTVRPPGTDHRAAVVDGQSFSNAPKIVTYTKEEIAKARKDFKSNNRELVADTHRSTEKRINFSGMCNADSMTEPR